MSNTQRENDPVHGLGFILAFAFAGLACLLIYNAAVTAYNGYQNYQAARDYIEGLQSDGEKAKEEPAQR